MEINDNIIKGLIGVFNSSKDGYNRDKWDYYIPADITLLDLESILQRSVVIIYNL
jgi:hypothetical protein